MKATRIQPEVVRPPAIIRIEMSEENARMLYALCGKFSGPETNENDPRFVTGALGNALGEALINPDYNSPPIVMRELSTDNVFLARIASQLPKRRRDF